MGTKDINELLNSGISDELLAAYIDGNTTANENQLIESSLDKDSMLSETYEIAHDGVSFSSSFDWELHKGDFRFWELGLPPTITESEIIATSAIDNDELLNLQSLTTNEKLSFLCDSFFYGDDSIDLNNLDIDDDMLEGCDILDL